MNAVARLVAPVRLVLTSLLDFFAPWRCMMCHAVLPSDTLWHYICQRCLDRLAPAPTPIELLAHIEQSGDPDECALSFVIARWSASPRQQPGLFDLVHALKYYGYWRIGVELGRELGAAVRLLAPVRYDALVPVPIHPARRRERGYNQAEAIAEGMHEILRIPVWCDAIRRTRYTQSQTRLSAAERRINTRDAFGAGKQAERLRGATVLIVDDVLTTGSTLNSVATAALQLGAARADAATIVVAAT
ncbi:MAG: phosphoribosyltransferase family protein [Chlorobi bacterium]|jgi:ComF family protein|nr:phosphoribosyltransferase family protein [Chlorobiota bacterium]